MTTTTCAPHHEAGTAPRPLARAAAALLAPLAAVALALAPSPALAHDVLTSSDPEDGATLETVPEEVVLTFNNAPMVYSPAWSSGLSPTDTSAPSKVRSPSS